MQTLLTGKRYTSSVATDLRKTFARIRREMERAKSKQAPIVQMRRK